MQIRRPVPRTSLYHDSLVYEPKSPAKTPKLEMDLFSSSKSDKYLTKSHNSGGVTDAITFKCVPGEKLGQMQLEVAIHATQGVPGMAATPLIYKRDVPASELMKLKAEQPRKSNGQFASKAGLKNSMPTVLASFEANAFGVNEEIKTDQELGRVNRNLSVHSGFLCDEGHKRVADFQDMGTSLRNTETNTALTVTEQLGFIMDVANSLVNPGSDVSQGLALNVMKKMMGGVGLNATNDSHTPGRDYTRVTIPGDGIRGHDFTKYPGENMKQLLGREITRGESRAIKADLAAVAQSLR